jgi:hypothetical protein
MRLPTKILGAAAVAGIIATGSAAFTATGFSLTSGSASADGQFIGGQASQAVYGTSVDSVLYTFADTARTHIQKVSLAFHTAIPVTSRLTVTASEVTASGAALDDPGYNSETGTEMFACTLTNTTHATCDVLGAGDGHTDAVTASTDYIAYSTTNGHSTGLTIVVADEYAQ